MAITAVTTRGRTYGQNKAASTSVLLTYTGVGGNDPPLADDINVVIVSIDNTQTTDGQTSEVTGVTDTQGNIYVKIGEFCNGQTAADAGATVSVWKSKLTTSLVNGNTVTATLANSKTAKALCSFCYTVGAGNDLALVAGSLQTLANDGADPGSMTISGLPSKEYLFIRGIASEATSTNGTASTNFTRFTVVGGTSGGSAATNMSTWGEYRIVTGTGATSDPTVAATDNASVFFALEETSPGPKAPPFRNLDPMLPLLCR